MRAAITTKFLGPSNVKGSRYKATARARGSAKGFDGEDLPELSLTDDANHGTNFTFNHARVAKLLAVKLGWHGLYICGGLPSGDGYCYVCAASRPYTPKADLDLYGVEDEDWFFVEQKEIQA